MPANHQTATDRINLKYDYGSWVDQILQGQYDNKEWKGYIVTYMFNHIVGSYERKRSVMENEIERVYATLVRHMVRDSRSASQRRKLPKVFAFPDYPRQQMHPFRRDDVTINDGLHYHGIFLVRTDTRMKVSLDIYLQANEDYFIKPRRALRRIHIEPIDRTPGSAVNYVLKSIEWRIPDSNQMLVLPKAISELPSRVRLRQEGSRSP